MNEETYYDYLEVKNISTVNEIKKSYRELAKRYHPDLNPNDKYSEERFKKISEAYEILTNYEKRLEYDNFLKAKDEMKEYYYSSTNNYSETTEATPEKENSFSKYEKLINNKYLKLLFNSLLVILKLFFIALYPVIFVAQLILLMSYGFIYIFLGIILLFYAFIIFASIGMFLTGDTQGGILVFISMTIALLPFFLACIMPEKIIEILTNFRSKIIDLLFFWF